MIFILNSINRKIDKAADVKSNNRASWNFVLGLKTVK